MRNQKDKYHLSMSGEYLVAAQMHRLKINASITYGNAKRADIIAFSEDKNKSIFVEVKTSQKGRWPIGSRVPEPTDKPWIFILLASEIKEPPCFYVMTQKEIHDSLIKEEQNYLEKYRLKHGEDYGEKPGVACMTLRIAESYKDKWDTISNLLG